MSEVKIDFTSYQDSAQPWFLSCCGRKSNGSLGLLVQERQCIYKQLGFSTGQISITESCAGKKDEVLNAVPC